MRTSVVLAHRWLGHCTHERQAAKLNGSRRQGRDAMLGKGFCSVGVDGQGRMKFSDGCRITYGTAGAEGFDGGEHTGDKKGGLALLP